MPTVRRDLHNVVIPLDLANIKDVEVLVETLQAFVKRKIPIRFGVVPMTGSASATQQAKILYHMVDAYGLRPALAYLESVSIEPLVCEWLLMYS
jgi:UDP-glucose:glycoprotein glucosyltransferase